MGNRTCSKRSSPIVIIKYEDMSYANKGIIKIDKQVDIGIKLFINNGSNGNKCPITNIIADTASNAIK